MGDEEILHKCICYVKLTKMLHLYIDLHGSRSERHSLLGSWKSSVMHFTSLNSYTVFVLWGKMMDWFNRFEVFLRIPYSSGI